MPESSDTRSLVVADVMGDWRHPQGRLRFSWLRMVRADLDLIDTSLEGVISFAEDRTMLSQVIDGITNCATIAMHAAKEEESIWISLRNSSLCIQYWSSRGCWSRGGISRNINLRTGLAVIVFFGFSMWNTPENSNLLNLYKIHFNFLCFYVFFIYFLLYIPVLPVFGKWQ